MLNDLIEFIASDNIAESLDKETLIKIGAQVVDGYDADRADRAPWEEKMKKAMDLALQNVKTKTFPWPNASNVMMPIITEAIVQYSSRMYPALVPPVDIVKGRPVGFDPTGEKQNASVRVSKHMSYQCLEQMEEWEEEFDRGFVVQPLLGNMYKKTYYDESLERNVSEMLSPNEFVMCNNAGS
jgi:chaperonin GroES